MAWLLPFAGLLFVVLLTWLIIIALEAKKRGRTGWWLYIVCAIVNPLNLVAIVLWYVKFRDDPWMRDGRPFM